MSTSESRQTTARASFRMTPNDAAALNAAATSSGVSVSAFARRAALRAAGRPVPAYERRGPDILAAVVGRAIGELGKLGNNVNQIARAANAAGTIDTRRFDAAVAALQALRVDFRAAYEQERRG